MQTTLKKLVFVTGTRADFGKIKSLIDVTQHIFDVHIYVTGMHMNERYGETLDEIKKYGYQNIFPYYNHSDADSMDIIAGKTIDGFSHFVKNKKPDLIILHGDRPETLACAIVGSFNNILTAHIEGGELSGTIDESIRHAVSKLCHIHFVSNSQAKQRLLQMGENEDSIFTIGSPGLDVLFGKDLPEIEEAKKYYAIPFNKYAIAVFHPVTTEIDEAEKNAHNFTSALLATGHNYVVVYPNNDHGSIFILSEYKRLLKHGKFKIFPSLRHSYYLTLLKHARYIIGNSSSGIMEAPCYKRPSINIGTRQHCRTEDENIIHCNYSTLSILKAIDSIRGREYTWPAKGQFGDGESAQRFLHVMQANSTWQISCQKRFNEMVSILK